MKCGIGSNITFGTAVINSGIDAIYSGSESAPISGEVFAFGDGGFLSVTPDGKNLIFTNIDGIEMAITEYV